MNIDKERLHKIAWFAGLGLALSAFFLPVINPDIFWHFSAARYMAEHGSVPRADFLAWTMQGREWVDFEWLSQLILYGLYKLGGFKLLVLFKGAVLAAVTVVSWRTAALSGRSRAVCPVLLDSEQKSREPEMNLSPDASNQKGGAWLYMPFFAAGIITNSDLRPENFSLLFFALLLYRLEWERLKGPPEFNLRDGVLAAVFFALWANLHAGYVYGLVLLVIYFLGMLSRAALPFIYGRSAGLHMGQAAAMQDFLQCGGELFRGDGGTLQVGPVVMEDGGRGVVENLGVHHAGGVTHEFKLNRTRGTREVLARRQLKHQGVVRFGYHGVSPISSLH